MHAKYRKFIDQYTSLNPREWALLKSRLVTYTYKKDEIIHYAGDICSRLLFVNSGLIRLYIIDENGKDHTWNICFNNKHAHTLNLFVVDYDSFVTQTASQISFEVLEDCELVSLSYNDMQGLHAKSKKSERIGRLIAELAYSHAHKLIIDRLTKNAKTRYRELIQKNPFLMDKVPQYHIASYLGITPQHLSRLKTYYSHETNSPNL